MEASFDTIENLKKCVHALVGAQNPANLEVCNCYRVLLVYHTGVQKRSDHIATE